jgi:hypothetical protein
MRTTVKAGDRFGRLTFIGDTGSRTADAHIISSWMCDCGNECAIKKSSVKCGTTKSCGCLSKESKPFLTHGMKGTKEYNTWGGMKERCNNAASKDYQRYGSRGITICPEWSDSFQAFFADMGYAPTPDHQIDRINTLGNYEKDNCRWATRNEQARNRTSSYDWYILGMHFETIQEAADHYNVKIQTIHKWTRGFYDGRRKTFTGPKNNCYTVARY